MRIALSGTRHADLSGRPPDISVIGPLDDDEANPWMGDGSSGVVEQRDDALRRLLAEEDPEVPRRAFGDLAAAGEQPFLLDREDPVCLTRPFRAAVPGSPETVSPSGERHP
ncbi:hypothetical protein [Actinokineospora spheciospongiae]|uniref:hypothetical protein n=1 Tax=Actinokineospora spheciospongiae TaxID=909613 RepID=UPI000D9A1F29|nr:hypothetical protein [Actinokineospora spheciospongiae]PWW67018.1 hypothetical protein DFQ13_101536 [Actinokineospora spheciospongiae]